MKSCNVLLIDEVNCKLFGIDSIDLNRLIGAFSFLTPNYFFNPKFKFTDWDGKVSFVHKNGNTFINLLDEIIPALMKLGYTVDFTDNRTPHKLPSELKVDPNIFAHVCDPDSGDPYILYDYQEALVNSIFANHGGIGIAGTGGGKANDINSKVLTTAGWVRMGDLTLDHKVITPSGDISNIVGIYPQGVTAAYEVTFHDGSKTITNPEHLWEVKRPKHIYRANTEKDIITTRQMAEFLKTKQSVQNCPGNISIPLTQPVTYYHSNPNLELDPYVLGVLLGDGTLTQQTIRFTSVDDEIVEAVSQKVALLGMQLTESTYTLGKTQMDWNVVLKPEFRNKNIIKSMRQHLDGVGIHGCVSYNKFIPNCYKYASVEERFELIQGLFDTDGTVGTNGSVSYTTVSEKLAKDVQEIIWSLGGTCNIRTNKNPPHYTHNGEKRFGRRAYHCIVGFPDTRNLFKLSRKKERCGIHADGRIELMRRVKEVKQVSDRITQCIMIDHPTHLYITDDFIVTHNTIMCASICETYYRACGFRSMVIVPKEDLVIQTIEDFKMWGLDVGEYSGSLKDINHSHVVSTWQALQHNKTIIKQFQTVIVDECQGLRGNVLKDLLNNHGNQIPIRIGVTATLPKEDADRYSIKSAVGSVQYEISAIDLIRMGRLAEPDLDIIVLEENLEKQYQDYLADPTSKPKTYAKFKQEYFPDFTAEKKYLRAKKDRREFIGDYISNMQGNTFCLVDSVDFGKKLQKAIPNSIFLHGKDKKKVRKEIYDCFKDSDEMIVIATAQIAYAGLNIKRIFNLVLIDIGKSFVRVMQSVGRGLRKAHDKDSVSIYDICSDLKYGKKHLNERSKIYKEAEYPFSKEIIKYQNKEEL